MNEVNIYNVGSPDLTLKSDLAAEMPLYIYLPDDKSYLLYSKSIVELLKDYRVKKPLAVSDEGVSFLLQSGVVPQPGTVYKNIYILAIGDLAKISTNADMVEIQFQKTFPFFFCDRKPASINEPNVDTILDLIADSVVQRLNFNQPSFLFHSGGKDSNIVALALARAGLNKEITCVSYSADNACDESSIAKKYAHKMEFNHKTLRIPKEINLPSSRQVDNYFSNIPFPCTDNAALAYPFYMEQINFENSNIIDGSGNDVYIGHIPGKTEYIRQRFSKFNFFTKMIQNYSSESFFDMMIASRAEWTGLCGFSFSDSRTFFDSAIDTHLYWKDLSENKKHLDYFDLRAMVRGACSDQEIFMRKVWNFACLTNSNAIFPWANEKVARYFMSLPEKHLFDRKRLRNKVLLREMLKNEIGMDSDKLGKMGYEFDFFRVLELMNKVVREEVVTCGLWNNKIGEVSEGIYNKIKCNHRRTKKLKILYNRLYLISAWYNRCVYVR